MKRLPTPAEMEARLRLLCAANPTPKNPDQDPDQDLYKSKIQIDQDQIKINPDGLDSQIKGQYAELLKTDPAYLQARAWNCHPATLTNATKRMGADWVRQQVAFVAGKKDVRSKGGYLARILAKNPF